MSAMRPEMIVVASVVAVVIVFSTPGSLDQRTPAEHELEQPEHNAVGEEAGEADADHADYDQVRAHDVACKADRRAQPDSGPHGLPEPKHHPCQTEADAQPVDDGGDRRGDHDIVEDPGRSGTE